MERRRLWTNPQPESKRKVKEEQLGRALTANPKPLEIKMVTMIFNNPIHHYISTLSVGKDSRQW